MRQVGRDELIHILRQGILGITPAVWRMLTSHDATTKLRGQLLVCAIQADKMKRLEILSSAPPPPPFHYADLSEDERPKLDE